MRPWQDPKLLHEGEAESSFAWAAKSTGVFIHAIALSQTLYHKP